MNANEQPQFRIFSKTSKLVFGAFLAAFAAIFQSAGVFGGFGYVFSMLTTLPILLSSMMSIRIGIMSYVITILLLMIFQPSELFVFPFTTGLLGISLGIAFRIWKSRLAITLFGGIALAIGIMALLYVFHFPVLGPSVTGEFDEKIVILILLFSVFYSWLWVVLGRKTAKLFLTSIKKSGTSFK
ncbi:hypothetical protein V7112_07395 [Bacillus sp. JJ1566]|uniref:hypothetical protein n=1 Tax=Bacillus sp. JJ1566 TaxID=3122961 RepID=UPI002FFDC6E9